MLETKKVDAGAAVRSMTFLYESSCICVLRWCVCAESGPAKSRARESDLHICMWSERQEPTQPMLIYSRIFFSLSCASDPEVTRKAKAGRNTADRDCLTADNHSKGHSLSQLAFEVCVNHTYYVRQTDCLCSANIQCFTVISAANCGVQLHPYSFIRPSVQTVFICISC